MKDKSVNMCAFLRTDHDVAKQDALNHCDQTIVFDSDYGQMPVLHRAPDRI